MASRKRAKRPPPPSSANILKELRANVYALLGLQTANAKSTEEKFGELDREDRENVKKELKKKFAGPRPDQKERQGKQKRSRRKKTRKNGKR